MLCVFIIKAAFKESDDFAHSSGFCFSQREIIAMDLDSAGIVSFIILIIKRNFKSEVLFH